MSRFCTALLLAGSALGLAAFSTAAKAEGCTNPDALGTSRTIAVDSNELPRIGTMQYRQSLPLEDHEVVITFDDGPLPPAPRKPLFGHRQVQGKPLTERADLLGLHAPAQHFADCVER